METSNVSSHVWIADSVYLHGTRLGTDFGLLAALDVSTIVIIMGISSIIS
jgi:hypothetical protein